MRMAASPVAVKAVRGVLDHQNLLRQPGLVVLDNPMRLGPSFWLVVQFAAWTTPPSSRQPGLVVLDNDRPRWKAAS